MSCQVLLHLLVTTPLMINSQVALGGNGGQNRCTLSTEENELSFSILSDRRQKQNNPKVDVDAQMH